MRFFNVLYFLFFGLVISSQAQEEILIWPDGAPGALGDQPEDKPSIKIYLALRKNNIPAEMHIYENGKHGVGLAMDDPILSTWSDRLVDWIKGRGLLEDIR